MQLNFIYDITAIDSSKIAVVTDKKIKIVDFYSKEIVRLLMNAVLMYGEYAMKTKNYTPWITEKSMLLI